MNRRILLGVGALALAAAACARLAAGDAAGVALEAPRVLTGATANLGTAPMVAVGPGGRRAAAWVSAPGGGSDGRLYVALADSAGTLGAPVEVRDPLGGIEPHGEAPPKLAYGADGALYALWVVGKEVPGRRFPAGALRFARSDDGGRTWGAPASVTDAPELFGSFNFHSLQAGRGDTVYAAWLDGRAGKSATYFTRSADGGRTWQPNVRVHAGESCPCCRTAVAPGRGDTVYAAWRTVAPGQVREVVVARSADGGRTWDAPVRAQRDGWVIDGCPHAGPSLSADAAGRVHVAWWSGKEGAAGVFYARSDDGGRSFGAPAPIGVAERSRPAHVQLAVAEGAAEGVRVVVAAWDDGTVNTPVVRVRVSRDGGTTFDDATAASDGARAATFPVLALDGARLSLAWSEEAAATDGHDGHGARMKDPKARMPLPTVGRRQVVIRDGTVH
jgi:hypothetical protein